MSDMPNLWHLVYDVVVAATWHQSFLCARRSQNATATQGLFLYTNTARGEGEVGSSKERVKTADEHSVSGRWHLTTGCLKQSQLPPPRWTSATDRPSLLLMTLGMVYGAVIQGSMP